MRSLQRGGAFGTFIIVLLLVAAGYYAYTQYMAPTSPPTCQAQLQSCLTKCRKTTTEAPQTQACQDACQRDAAACK
jgi:hypothetical protein